MYVSMARKDVYFGVGFFDIFWKWCEWDLFAQLVECKSKNIAKDFVKNSQLRDERSSGTWTLIVGEERMLCCEENAFYYGIG